MKRGITVLVIMAFLLPLFLQWGADPAYAWDSIPKGTASHWQFLRDAINDLYGEDPKRYGELKSFMSELQDGSVNEAVHAQTRSVESTFPEQYYRMAVGNNDGNNHPEYYWQTAIDHYRHYVKYNDVAELGAAYFYLGSLIHIIEDMSAPPHAYNVMHGGLTGQDNFELLAFNNLYYEYHTRPDSTFHPGKNILDVDNHGDDDFLQIELKADQNDWVELFQTNLQAPAARKVRVELDYPFGRSAIYLKFEYQRLVNGVSTWVSFETPKMGATNSETITWPDSFAPNTTLKVSYRRPGSGSIQYTRFTVFVLETQDVRNEMQDPGYKNPWEYADWLRTWTIEHATSAPYWRRYWNDGEYGDLRFDITWTLAPNTERALLSMLDRATQETVKWVLQSAMRQFEILAQDPNTITDTDAIGRYSYRVVLYKHVNYNSTDSDSPEYIRSLSLACTPYPNKPCEPLIINDLTWMTAKISSIEVRNARVFLFSGNNLTGQNIKFTADDPSLADNAFNDKAQSLMILPYFRLEPSIGQPVLTDAYPKLFDFEWPVGSGKKEGPGMEVKWYPGFDEAGQAYTKYEIEVSEDSGGTWQACGGSCGINLDGYFQHHGDLTCGDNYYRCLERNQEYTYRMRGISGANQPSAWSDPISAISMEWLAHVELAPEPNLSEYPSGSVVRLNLQNSYGRHMQLEWQIFPQSVNVQYEMLGGCQNGYIYDASANYCELRISLVSSGSAFGEGGSTKLAAPLMAIDAVRVYVKGTDSLGYSSDDFVVLNLKKSSDPTPPTQETVFVDVASDHWAKGYIEYLYNLGYISGCEKGDSLEFCPYGLLSRSEVAVVLVRSFHPDQPGYMLEEGKTVNYQDMLEGKWDYKWVAEFDELGMTAGCSNDPPLYCPTAGVSRIQMAVFAVKIHHGVDVQPIEPESPSFKDVPKLDEAGQRNWQFAWVEQALQDGLIQDCDTDMENMVFEPEKMIDRATMACMMYFALQVKLVE